MDQTPKASYDKSAFPSQAAGSSADPQHAQTPSLPGVAGGSSVPTAPSLSLPKGGGAISGMGEKFDVNMCTGTATTSIPVHTSPARSGMTPQLAITYDSGAGNSEFGLGWRLSGWESITRKTAKGLPRYNDTGDDEESDVFLVSGSEDLVPLFKRDSSGNVILAGGGAPVVDESIVDGYIVRRYSPRINQTFSRIERWSSITDLGDMHWRVIDSTNSTTIFGSDSSSRVQDPDAEPGSPQRIFSWLASESYDVYGNALICSYKAEDSVNVPASMANEVNRSPMSRSAARYLKSIRYGNKAPNRAAATWLPFSAFDLPDDTWMFSLVFDYGEHDHDNPKPSDSGPWNCRLDPFSSYLAGFEIRKYRLCQRVLMFHHFAELSAKDCLVVATNLSHTENSIATYLSSVQHVGYSIASSGNAYTMKALPPVEFQYSLFPSDDELEELLIEDISLESLTSLPVGVDNVGYRWVDLDGEGLSGILSEEVGGGGWYYKRNTSANNFRHPKDHSSDLESESSSICYARLGAPELVRSIPSTSLSDKEVFFGDVSGSGKSDLIQTTSSCWGFFERALDSPNGWDNFKSFSKFPNINISDRNVKFVDLTGDGLPDILIQADQLFCWFESLGVDGYGPGQVISQGTDENVGPVCIYSDSEECIYMADMSGDGLTDIVRIKNFDVSYWPNCGYGRFGRLVRMDNAPSFDCATSFHQSRIRLADIDGSGTTDILYIGSGGLDIYLNQSGNAFNGRKSLKSFPALDDMSRVNALDLLGNGTSCIVWSSPLPAASRAPLKYVDLTKGTKPYMLTAMVNNFGSEMKISYAPSTKFYLQDKEAGVPWITNLPFPVHCVEKVQIIDHISHNRFVKKYSYHNGYFDGVEREFRGFARVDVHDTENYAEMGKAESTNVNIAWHASPVLTKTWFHSGIFFDREKISRHMALEYFNAPKSTNDQDLLDFYSTLLPDTVVPDESLDADAIREACRALKGHILRVETYGEDGTAKASIPYSVQESNFSVKVQQGLQDVHGHSIYSVQPRETISYHFERNTEDPRVTHEMALQIDDFGNILKSLRIGYGRRRGKSNLTGSAKTKQETTSFAYSEQDVTKLLDTTKDYRVPLPFESRQYELSGFSLPEGSTRFTTSHFDADDFKPILSTPSIPYELVLDPSTKQKRLIGQYRMLYRKDDLSGLLSPGVLEPLGLPGADYTLCFTPGLINKAFHRHVPGQNLENLLPDPKSVLGDIGYIDLENNGSWWKTGGRVFYSRSSAAEPSQELIEARNNFYLPHTFSDALGNERHIAYDSYLLHPIFAQDSVGNVTSVEMDYRVLAPKLITDPNGNRNAAAYDALGLVAGSAIMGKLSENKGDNLDNFRPDLTQAELDLFFTNPRGPATLDLLQNATNRMVLDTNRYWQHKSDAGPCYSASMTRETHFHDLEAPTKSKIQIGICFSDGFGRVIQEKAQAKPGPLIDNGGDIANRWVVNGWTIFNNKGKPVRQYEPFFDDTHEFKFANKIGVSPILLYDPLLRLVATVRQDHALEKVLFSPWSQTFYDCGDNVMVSDPKNDPDVGHYFELLPEQDYLPSWYDTRIRGQLGPNEKAAALKTALHANTPRVSHVDALERVILVTEDNGGGELFSTETTFDIQGHQRALKDAKNRTVMTADFSMCGENIHQASMEAGERWALNNVLGQAILSWNSRNFRFRNVYDANGRNKESWVKEGNSIEVMFEQDVYGESAPNAKAHNLAGRIWKARDQTGEAVSLDFDFKGNLLHSQRQTAVNYTDTVDWSQVVDLDSTIYASLTTFDAINRPVTSTAPDMTVNHMFYDEGRALNSFYVNVQGEQQSVNPTSWTPIFTSTNHNARGQLTKMSYGNGVVNERFYQPLLHQIQGIKTTRPSATGTDLLQDLSYTYDVMGNPTFIKDAAQQTIYFRNNVVDPGADFTYDALSRLVVAKGREHLGQANGSSKSPTAPSAIDPMNVDNPADGQAMGTYTEVYTYDAVGNFLSINHDGSDPRHPGWTRFYSYNEPSQLEPQHMSNKLSFTQVGSITDRYVYDAHGNMTSMPHLSSLRWNFRDQLRSTAAQIVNNGGTPETTYYIYDSTGQRVRKVTNSQTGPNSTATAGIMKDRLYMGDFEVSRIYEAGGGSSVTVERTTLKVLSDSKATVLLELRTQGTDDGSARIMRFQHDNQLGSACIEIDDQARIISYEEYFPYGSTSYRAVTNQSEVPKRYRYSGKEKDNENAFYYYGGRYFACWLGRWISCDPAGFADGPNPYLFTQCNPIANVDPDGMWSFSLFDAASGAWESAKSLGKGVAIGVAVAVVAVVVVGVVVVATGGAALPLVLAAAPAVVTGLEVAGAVATGVGIASTVKTAGDVITGEDLFTGEKLSDQERSRRVGSGLVDGIATVAGVKGVASASKARSLAAASKLESGAVATAKLEAGIGAGASAAESGAGAAKAAPVLEKVAAAEASVAKAAAAPKPVPPAPKPPKAPKAPKATKGKEPRTDYRSPRGQSQADPSKFDIDQKADLEGIGKLQKGVADRLAKPDKDRSSWIWKTEWHHVFSDELSRIFLDRWGIKVDDWLIPINQIQHDVIHGSEVFKSFNLAWKTWLDDPANAGATIEQLFAQASKMLQERGLGRYIGEIGQKPATALKLKNGLKM